MAGKPRVFSSVRHQLLTMAVQDGLATVHHATAMVLHGMVWVFSRNWWMVIAWPMAGESLNQVLGIQKPDLQSRGQVIMWQVPAICMQTGSHGFMLTSPLAVLKCLLCLRLVKLLLDSFLPVIPASKGPHVIGQKPDILPGATYTPIQILEQVHSLHVLQ